MAKITEAYMPYLGHRTYYRIVGEKSNNNKKPLLLLHGGPGSTHNYFEVLDRLADEDSRQIIMYDQIGCGNSFVEGKPELWTKETWVGELKDLRKHLGLDEVHILGQSWGGMLSIIYACDHKPEGVKSYILSSTLPCNELWEREQKRRIKFLPDDVREAIEKAVENSDYTSKEYEEAVDVFMRRHCYNELTENSPECLKRKKKAGTEAYIEAWGPNEFTPIGTLKDYDYRDKLRDVTTPCLIVNGMEDLCSPYIAKAMYDLIPNASWELFEYSKHMCFVDENDKYVAMLKEWLAKND